jgi:hypothetical protein
MRNTPAGLYLWNIVLRNTSYTLWITTARQCAETAARKARVVLKTFRKRDGCAAAAIDSIEYNGTIDA